MNLDNKYPLAALRIVPVAYMISIGAFVVFGEYQLASGAEGPWMTPTMSGRGLQIFQIAVSVLSALMVALAITMKRTVMSGSPGGMRKLVKGIMKSKGRGRGRSGVGVVLVPLALSETVAVLGLVLFFIGGGERLLCYPFYGAALLSLITVLPNKDYLTKLVALDKEVVMEMRG
ncbi:MAG: hypothetical protein KOO61_05650 [Spirochaetales bacterium]|nr:hypothetical protein [Spirochaetales bacterium]